MFQSYINAATAFPFCAIAQTMEPLTPRSPFSRDGAFFYPPSSPSCSSGGIPSPRLVSPSLPGQTKKTSFTIEAILGINDKHNNNDDDVFRQTLCPSSPDSSVKDLSTRLMVHSNTSLNGSPVQLTLPTQMAGQKRKSSECSSKSKRIRTIFTPEQLERLETEFERQQYMVGPERLYLAASLNLSEAQVKVWFQNRRIKWRKNHLEQQQARLANLRKNSTGEDICDDEDRLHEDDLQSDDEDDEDIVKPSTVSSTSSESEFNHSWTVKTEQH